MNPLRSPPVEPVLRDAAPDEMATILRAVMGLPPGEVAPGEIIATLRRSMPPLVRDLDAGGWIAWCLVGLVIFAERTPIMKNVRLESARVVMGLAMLQSGGNLTVAAKALGMSRKALRDNLNKVGLYPWCHPTAEDSDWEEPDRLDGDEEPIQDDYGDGEDE